MPATPGKVTASDLIAVLETMPQDAEIDVWYPDCREGYLLSRNPDDHYSSGWLMSVDDDDGMVRLTVS